MNIKTPNEMVSAEFARWRSSMYLAASSAFEKEPTSEELSQLINLSQISIQNGIEISDYEAALYEHMAMYAQDDRAELRKKVCTEYAELFIGPRPALAPFYESMYLGYPNRIYTQVTQAVRDYYEQNGFQVIRKNHIPDDQLGFELEFMALLCERQSEMLDAGLLDDALQCARAQYDFLRYHLAQWLPLFVERVEQAECAEYFAAWARFSHAFVNYDEQQLSSIVDAEFVSPDCNQGI